MMSKAQELSTNVYHKTGPTFTERWHQPWRQTKVRDTFYCGRWGLAWNGWRTAKSNLVDIISRTLSFTKHHQSTHQRLVLGTDGDIVEMRNSLKFSKTFESPYYIYIYIYIYVCVCVCVCVCETYRQTEKERQRHRQWNMRLRDVFYGMILDKNDSSIYIYIYNYVCVCKTERDRESGDREIETEREKLKV